LLAGIYAGFVELQQNGKISRMPHMLAASSAYKNPIVTSFRQGLDHCVDLRPEKIKESKVNEPLINWHSFDGEEALEAVRESGGQAFHISDEKMLQQTKWLREKEGLQVLPASTAGLVGLLAHHQQHVLPEDQYVAVLTARL
jgi:threonine synthase